MAKEQVEPPEHVRWRSIGESVTSPYMNTQRKEVFIDPCECIKKLFDAAKAAVDKVPKEDAVFGGSQRAAAMRTVRGVNQFHAHVKAYEFAKTAATIYNNTVPGKWRVATEAQLKECGLKSTDDLQLIKYEKGAKKNSQFKAHIAIPENLAFCEPMPATLVFKGTNPKETEDLLNNLQQGIEIHSEHYQKAVQLGAMVKNASRPMAIAGHSLGGGLAAACAHTSGKDTWTFNAAGVHSNTVQRYGEVPVPANIQAYRHEGEMLTAVQEPGWLVRFAQVLVPPVAGVWLGGPMGAVIGGWVATKLVRMPAAPGTKHDLPCINDEWHAAQRHKMKETLSSFNKMLREMEAELRKQTGVQCKQPVVV